MPADRDQAPEDSSRQIGDGGSSIPTGSSNSSNNLPSRDAASQMHPTVGDGVDFMLSIDLERLLGRPIAPDLPQTSPTQAGQSAAGSDGSRQEPLQNGDGATSTVGDKSPGTQGHSNVSPSDSK